jgi:hypothetical protein
VAQGIGSEFKPQDPLPTKKKASKEGVWRGAGPMLQEWVQDCTTD